MAEEIKEYTFLSLGAGVQSSTMALMAAKGEITPMPDAAIFADTGWEPAYVYKWLEWLSERLPFPVHRVSAGNLREDLARYVKGKRVASVPFFTETDIDGEAGKLRRQCTREYKIEPINRKIREIIGLKPRQWAKKVARVTSLIGISLDEISRMKPSREPWTENRWPLIDKGMTRNDCFNWMESNGYPLPRKSSCIGCPFHDDATWRDMKLSHPEDWADAVEVDRMIRSGVRGTKQKLYLHRSLTPLEDVDLRNLEDMGQVNMFNEECEGMCGL